jgi:hypothetical protein
MADRRIGDAERRRDHPDAYGGPVTSRATGVGPVELALPFLGRWQARNSPARRVPSHGTDLFGVTYAIDFVAVDDDGRSARRTWRSWISVEPPTIFVGFGVPILAPASGTVVQAIDGEPDHEARRSVPTQVAYALDQPRRVRAGASAIAGNHVVLEVGTGGPFVLLAHLREGSVLVRPGDVVVTGEAVGQCGNSGNSTEPHVHVQATDSVSWPSAVGLPLTFRRPGGGVWLPAESEIVEAG